MIGTHMIKLAFSFLSLTESIVAASRSSIPDHKIHLRAYDKPDSVYHVALIGETLQIESNENPSTGFKWLVEDFGG